jgi:4'-phosphopantetheinyl transferase
MGSATSSPNPNWQPLVESWMPAGLRLWFLNLDAAPAELDLLSDDERDRAARFRFHIHQRRFVAGRTALRTILAGKLGGDARRIQFHYSEFGKPSVKGLEFNLAHSENLALLAIANRPVGVDFEFKRPIDFDPVAKTVFSAAELANWNRMTSAEKPLAFYSLWTRKEALLKGIGCGIADRVQNVSVFFDDPAPLDAPPGWVVHSVRVSENFAAAVAWGPQPATCTAT